MKKQHRAKLFANGRSQAVRIPLEFRFSGKEVYIRRDEQTGDVILSERPDLFDFWREYFATPPAPSAEDFLADRDTTLPIKRDLL
jgi:antitoxin VapB